MSRLVIELHPDTESQIMPNKVRIPTPLRKLTNNEELVEVNGATIADAIAGINL
jgi:hypothetical protein